MPYAEPKWNALPELYGTRFRKSKRGLAKAVHSGDPAFDALPGYFRQRLGPTLGSLLEAATASGEIRAGISPEMAVRLSIAFDTSAESWLNQQVQYDLWHAERNRGRLHVERLTAA